MNIDLKIKLFFLTVVPTIIILVLSGLAINNQIENKEDLEFTKNNIYEAREISQIIHLLQIERGLSVGYISAKVEDKQKALTEARQNLDSLFVDIKPSIKNIVKIETLARMRKSIDNLTISELEVKDYYTKEIGFLLDFAKVIPTIMEDRVNRNYIQAYSYLSYAKENLGQIRAILNEVFISKNLTQENFEQINENMSIYFINTKAFKQTLYQHSELIDSFQSSIKEDVFEKMLSTINTILKKRDISSFEDNPKEWFSISTQSINILKNVEEKLFNVTDISIQHKIENSTNIIYSISLALFVLLNILSLFMHTIIKKILLSAYMLSEKFENSLVLLEQYKITVDENFIVSKTDANGNICYANDEFCRISGYSKEELMYKNHNIIRHPDVPQKVFESMWSTIKYQKKPWTGNIKNRAKDGSLYWMKTYINPIVDKNNEIVEFIAMRIDITELQEEKEHIRKTLGITVSDFEEARHLAKEYENAIDSAWSVIRTDIDHKITFANETFFKISGYTKDEILGRIPMELRSEQEQEVLKQKLLNREIVQTKFENISKDNKSCHMDTTIVPIADSRGDIVEYLYLMSDISEIVSLHLDIESTQQEVIYRMGEISESRSKETGMHIQRVANYSRLLAIKAGLCEEEANLIANASPMHDIGKVAIADSILLKPGSFDEEEWKIMQTHSEIGYKVLSGSSRPLLNAAAIIAKEHHEKYDGSGYPQKLSGEDIHIYARIVAIADVFDALGSDRVYKKAWDFQTIIEYFEKNKNKHFDAKLVELFLNHIDEFLEIRDRYKEHNI